LEAIKVAQSQTFKATGRRKKAVARVILKPGKGPMQINGLNVMDYFKVDRRRIEVERPLVVADKMDDFTVWARINGGGLTGQAQALKLGIARALVLTDQSLRKVLKKDGLLTRDARIVERKKYGKRGARRGTQFSKR
jgi:small subunit ribosomal protein S9